MSDNISHLFQPIELDVTAMEILAGVQKVILPLVYSTSYLNPKFTIDLEQADHSTLEFEPENSAPQKMFMSKVSEELIPLLKKRDGATKLVVQKPRGGEFEIHLFISGKEYIIPLLPRQW